MRADRNYKVYERNAQMNQLFSIAVGVYSDALWQKTEIREEQGTNVNVSGGINQTLSAELSFK